MSQPRRPIGPYSLKLVTSWYRIHFLNRLERRERQIHQLVKRFDRQLLEDLYLKEYTKKKKELLAEFGTPQQGGNFNISPDKVEKFQEAFKSLNEEYKEPLESFKAREKELQEEYKENGEKFEADIEELLEEEVEVITPEITTEDLEKTMKDGIEPKQLIQLDWLIKESE